MKMVLADVDAVERHSNKRNLVAVRAFRRLFAQPISVALGCIYCLERMNALAQAAHHSNAVRRMTAAQFPHLYLVDTRFNLSAAHPSAH